MTAKNNFLEKIRKDIPNSVKVKVRNYAEALIKKGEEEKKENKITCKSGVCRCVDMEDWFIHHE